MSLTSGKGIVYILSVKLNLYFSPKTEHELADVVHCCGVNVT